MGYDKALILIDGVPLLHRVCSAALQVASEIYVVTPWVDRYQAILPSRCKLVQEQPISLEEQTSGPLVGFAQGLAQVQTEWVLLLACDLPRLQGEVLEAWVLQLGQVSKEMALLPKGPKGWEPLCGLYRVGCLASLNASIQAGTRSFQHWLSQEAVKELYVGNRSILFNCNTPDDLFSLTSKD